MQARLESERLARESAAHQSDAQQMRTDVDERLRKADAVDPDVDTDRNDGMTRDRGAVRADGDATDATARTDRTAAYDDTVRDDTIRDDTVRDDTVHDDTARDGTVRDHRDLTVDEHLDADTQRRDTETGRRI
jgi:hypothetical protein